MFTYVLKQVNSKTYIYFVIFIISFIKLCTKFEYIAKTFDQERKKGYRNNTVSMLIIKSFKEKTEEIFD